MISGCVEGFEGQEVCGWVLSNEGTCRISIADADGNVVANGAVTKSHWGLDSSSYHFRFRVPTGFPAKSPVLRVFADGQELVGSPLALGPNLFDGAISIVDGTIIGWVQERTADTAPCPVDIHDQYGRLVASVMPARDNQDGLYRFQLDAPAWLYGWPEIGLSAACGGRVFAKTTCSLPVEGYLDRVESGRIAGWALIPGLPERKVRLQVCLNGEPATEVSCDMPRGDLDAKYPNADREALRCGFDLALPETVRPTAARILSLRLVESGVELFNGPHGIGNLHWAVETLRKVNQTIAGCAAFNAAEGVFLRQAFAALTTKFRVPGANIIFKAQTGSGPAIGQEPRVSVIIPVYRDIAATRGCIESVLAHRCEATDTVIVINDKSPDLAMSGMLEAAFGRTPNLWILSNPKNRGFVGTVNRGLGMARRGDVILLNSDTEIHAGGLDELVECAAQSKTVGTVTPLSNIATIFTYPHPTQPVAALDDMSWPEIAALALQQPRRLIDVPTGHGFCLYIKREVLDQVGILDEAFGRGYGEENDFCQRATDLGYRHVAAPTVFVRHRESISFGEEKDALRAKNLAILGGRYPEYQALIERWLAEDPLREARWAIDRERLRRAREGGRRFAVSIENDVTGGTVQARADIEENVGYGGCDILRCRTEGMQIKLISKTLDLISVYGPDEIDAMFATFDIVQPALYAVHQLLGYSERFIRQLTAAGDKTPIVFFAHDFYTFCPRVTMIDSVNRFCAARFGRCVGCMALGGAHERATLKMEPDEHRDLFGAFLHACRHVIAPSRDATTWLMGAFPGLIVRTVPHPEVRPLPLLGEQKRDPAVVVVLGAIGPHKGSAALLEVARTALLDSPELRFHVVGYTNIDAELAVLDNVVLHGKYAPADLDHILQGINAATALFLHQWPETYSYTLSEVVRHGLVPIISNLGAPVERVREWGLGRVVSIPIVATEVIDTIHKASHDDPRSVQEEMTKAAFAATERLAEFLDSVLKETGRRVPIETDGSESIQVPVTAGRRLRRRPSRRRAEAFP